MSNHTNSQAPGPQPDPHARDWRAQGREPARGGSANFFRCYAHSASNGFVPIRFNDPLTPETWLPRGRAFTVQELTDYGRRMLGALTPDRSNVEFLLAVAAEFAAERRPMQPIPILVAAIPPERWAAWAEVLLDAICSAGFDTLESLDRERLARLHATFVKVMPAENTASATRPFQMPRRLP